LCRVNLIADAKPAQLKDVLGDEKTAKQVHNAAKRTLNKKRSAATTTGDADADADPSPQKAKKPRRSAFELRESNGDNNNDGADEASKLEASLVLPALETDEQKLAATTLLCNRAPVVLAFGVVLLQYTRPAQPLSSRLSLAQAAVSMNSRSKAVSLGLEKGKSADEEGWGAGQRVVRVMGREVRTMKRVGWGDLGGSLPPSTSELSESSSSRQSQRDGGDSVTEEDPPLWALDLEALRGDVGGQNDGTGVGSLTGLPIYTPQSARSYLLKSFDRKAAADGVDGKKVRGSSVAAEREKNLGMLLGALDLLFKSWSTSLNPTELDSKAWNWYVQVRPSVPDGVSGWGAKGELRLADILRLRKG
jgi:hypothetical protein